MCSKRTTIQLKESEQWVKDSLLNAGFDVEPWYPDPPDLIVNGTIGVEVRRLNQHYFSEGVYESVDSASQAFRHIFLEVIEEFPNLDRLPSAMISYTMFRPLLTSQENRRNIKNILTEHLPHIDQTREYEIDRMEIRIVPWYIPMENRYFIGAMEDGNKGGLVHKMALENFPIALNAKEKDLPRYQALYSECWLALIDEMCFWYDDYSLTEIAKTLSIETNFDKILLFSPFKHFAFTTMYSKTQV